MHEHQGDHVTTTDIPCGGDCGCGIGKRNRFFRGKHMNAEAFALDQGYLIGRRRLVNRAVLGWGVVYGFPISAPRDKEPLGARDVGGGLGIDPGGREVHLVGPVTITPANTFLSSGGRPRPADRIAPGRYLLSIHYAERRVQDAKVGDDCGCGEPEKQFVCETAVFSLERVEECPCAQEDCPPCRCPEKPSKCCEHGGRGCACLCEWVVEGPDDCPPDLCEWNGQWIDPSGGIPLACVVVALAGEQKDERARRCDPIRFTVEDDCGPRRIVKGNELLYDLLRGCDLTRIAWIGWGKWHRREARVEWEEFARMFKGGPHWKIEEPVETEFVFRFTGPVVADSFVRRDAIAITVIAIDQSTGWELVRRVPIARLDTRPNADPAKLPAGTTDQVRVYVTGDWAHDELEPGRSWLSDREFAVELELRGDLVRDCREKAVDGNTDPHQRDGAPSGNGTAGGTFFSTFRVAPKPGAAAAS